MLLPIARVAAAAITGSLVYNTGRNVYETIQCTKQIRNSHEQNTIPTTSSSTTTNELQSNHLLVKVIDASMKSTTSSESQQQRQSSIVELLQKMSRQQLLDLYLNHCTIIIPTTTATTTTTTTTDISSSSSSSIAQLLDGEWNGILLNNNGLTRTTRFITNRLFGMNRRWNGKSFIRSNTNSVSMNNDNDNPHDVNNVTTKYASSSLSIVGTGWNRFDKFKQYKKAFNNKNQLLKTKPSSTTSSTSTSTSSSSSSSSSSSLVILKTEFEHCFQYNIDASNLYPNDPSIVLKYSPYQKKLSLWNSMVDEIRILSLSSSTSSCIDHTIAITTTYNTGNTNTIITNNYDILIGLGSMNWSGGIWNCAPFCLYRKKR